MSNNTSSEVFVIGHKNPDTDSICSAIALAELKNKVDKTKHYTAKRAGQINGETAYVLKKFGFRKPTYIDSVGTQVKDMAIRTSPYVDCRCTLKKAWDIMNEYSLVTLPVRKEDGSLDGVITMGDIASTYMESALDSKMLSQAAPTYGAIAETINGTLEVGDPGEYYDTGKVLIGAGDSDALEKHIEKGDLVIMAGYSKLCIEAIECGAGCLILTLDITLSEKIQKAAEKSGCVIITSSQDTYSVARKLLQSIPLNFMMKRSNIITFSSEDYTDSIRDIMVQHKHRAFPVIDPKGKCIGTISRRNFLGISKKQVILVDHNDLDQAVDNIDGANILEIIDHHRLGDVQTVNPILFRNEPVGCTATILYKIFQEERIDLTPNIAGLLCSAIISDTLMFRSPTCTLIDKMAAGALALIAGIDIEKHATEMFRAGSDLKSKSPEEIFYQDFKKFSIGDDSFGIGQISSLVPEELNLIKDKMLAFMRNECGQNGISQVYFMLTNILSEQTELLYCGEGSKHLVEDAFKVNAGDESCILPGVVSRKKQLVPKLLLVLQEP